MKTVMILGGSILQLPAIIKARDMGYKVIVCDMNPNAVAFREDGIVKEIISTTDSSRLLECAKKYQIDAVLTICTDQPMNSVAKIANELHLRGLSERTAFLATNKFAMRKCLCEHGVPCPAFAAVSSINEYLKAIKSFPAKFIVKPVDSSGSRGVRLVNDSRDEGDVIEAFVYCKKSSHSGQILLEEYMEGPEVSVETLTVGGVCHVIQITDKLTTGAPHFVEIGHSQPSRLNFSVQERIKQVAIAANKAIGIRSGPSHTEIIVTKEGPKVVELGARLGGDCITTHLVPLSTGVDMVSAVINDAMGLPVDYKHRFEKGSCIRFFDKSVVGRIKRIEGFDEVREMDGVIDAAFMKKEGDFAVQLNGSGDRIAFVISQKETVDEAVKCCDEAIKKIVITTE